MRLFIAITLPEAVKARALEARRLLEPAGADVKWVEYENYHLTLKFLGEVDPNRLGEINKALSWASGNCAAFDLECKGIGFFPNPRHPRVVWLGSGGDVKEAEFLGQTIDTALTGLGFEPERKRSFHLTLGRIRSERNTESLTAIAAASAKTIRPVGLRVADFYLMESQLSSAGPHYQVKQSFKLKPSGKIYNDIV